ncbi:MAG: DEAD/DEAH box helicase [Chloroflexi bacterium]|nr:DEAD/DEAH box helicase [Chloroflexota bacterium]MQC18682.1 DEAD/DEAH box helicase [Chloroflexota bacterium]
MTNASSASMTSESPTKDAPGGQRRGRSAPANGDTTADTASDAASAGRGKRDSYQWGRRAEPGEADQRSRQANRRRRDVRSRNLDQPLPEDVAFRPGGEGGDTSILPNRRRRPVGFHDTARTLMGGARTAGTWVKRDERHGADAPADDEGEPTTPEPRDEAPRASRAPAPAAPSAPSVTRDTDHDDAGTLGRASAVADDEDDESASADSADAPGSDADAVSGADAERPRRRRGRRGGRGRRRADGDAPEATDDADPTAVDDDEDAADDLDDSDDPDASDDHNDDETDDDADEEAEVARPRPRREQQLAPVTDDQIPAAFANLGIKRPSLEQIARFGYTEPTPIQVEAIPALLNGLDVVGIAQTGSGKTVAFGVPMVEKLDPQLPEVQGIVLVPTRELAQQVLEVLTDLARPWGLEAVGLLGGRSLKADFRALDDRPHIVVGTPGRILDHLRRQTLSLRHVRYAVLDEADQMLDIGFLPDIRRILSRTPQRRQTALFSATMPGSIKRLIWQFMTDPETVRVDGEATTVDTIEQIYFEVAQRDKVRAMRELIERELKGRTLIFCNMKRSVDHLARELERDGVRVRPLHGDLDQRQRDRVIQEFRSGEIDALIATNVAARGLDIPEITHVVNYDVPQNLEEYVHRIGRTGRAGRDGKAITFVCEWDVEAFDTIARGIGTEIARQELDLYSAR